MTGHYSERLSQLAGLVTDGMRLADIGCDHALLPVMLCAEGKIPSAIAADLRRGPLESAAENIRNAGLSDRIETRLSDGFRAFLPGEADSAVIAGMGGILICRILRRSLEVVSSLKELILGPQSDAPLVRMECEKAGLAIADERLVLEDGKYYPLIRLIPGGPSEPASRAAFLFGPVLLGRRDPSLHNYLLRQQRIMSGILHEIGSAGGNRNMERKKQVKEYLRDVAEALKGFREERI